VPKAPSITKQRTNGSGEAARTPAVGAELEPEEDDAFSGGLRLQIATLEREAIGRRERHVLGLGIGLAEGDDEEGLLRKDAMDEAHVPAQDDDVNHQGNQDRDAGEDRQRQAHPEKHGSLLAG
jgi:hypothetical protein